MTLGQYNAFCAKLPHTTHVIQWGDAHVWKVGGKVFTLAHAGSARDRGGLAVTFKCSPLAFEMLKDAPGMRPAPYLASRGLFWLQRTSPEHIDDNALRDYLCASYRLVAEGLPRKHRIDLGLEPARSATSKPRNFRAHAGAIKPNKLEGRAR